jgi:SAM-dependent methyltransferase
LTRCPGCQTVLARSDNGVIPTGADYTQYHREADFRVSEAAQASLDALVASAAPYRRLGGWLDVGFGEGGLLRAAERQGWDCAGVEASPEALAFGRAEGWAVAEPHAAADLLPESGFDVVTLIEVIEHLEDPVRVLRQAVGWLRPGGLLYLTTPNVHSLNRRFLGPRWSIFCPPEHLTIWSPRGLKTALSRLGLTRVRLWTHGFNPAEILAILKGLGPDVPVHRQRAADSMNRALSKTPMRRAAKRFVNGLLTLGGVGDTLKAGCEKSSRGA